MTGIRLSKCPKEYAHDVLTLMKDRYIKGNKVSIELAK